jgi:hypothetical protein
MSKIGLLAFTVAIALAGVGYAADKITLNCEGTATVVSQTEPSVGSIQIDIDNGIVLINPGDHNVPITKITEQSITFSGNSGGFLVNGSMDRISGATSMNVSGDSGLMWVYHLMCKPAKPLF